MILLTLLFNILMRQACTVYLVSMIKKNIVSKIQISLKSLHLNAHLKQLNQAYFVIK